MQSALENSRTLKSVIVVDNGSTDTTSEVLARFKSKFEECGFFFTVIRNGQNKGFGSACNQGIRLAQTDYVAILNNDTWLMPEWDRALIEALKQKDFDMVGPFFDERPWPDDIQERVKTYLSRNPPKTRFHFVPILMFFTKDAIAKLELPGGGIFDERFFVTYEDTDLLYRMKKLNLTYAQTSRCYIWHQSMGTRAEKGALPVNYEADGLKRFIEKWGFDPRRNEHSLIERLKRRYRKYQSARGMF